MTEAVRVTVRQRAANCCEYCRLPQSALPFTTFQIHHQLPLQHGGDDSLINLALACDRCNAFKGPNLTAIDPITGKISLLFRPRQQLWHTHFRQVAFEIEGLTETGRATVQLLQMNAARRVKLREELQIDLR